MNIVTIVFAFDDSMLYNAVSKIIILWKHMYVIYTQLGVGEEYKGCI